jgi:hypothetical protein
MLQEVKNVFEIVFLQILIFFFIRRLHAEGLIFEQIFLSAIISIILIIIYKYSQVKNDIFKLMYLALLIACLFQFIFVNIDRSRSFYVISWVKNYDISIISGALIVNEGFIQSSEFSNSLAIKNRIDEQIVRGIIDINSENDLKLSIYGDAIYTISNTLSNIFNLSGWQQNKF